MDFWRPNYSTTPYVNGVYSTQQYLDSLKTTWLEYQKRYQLTLDDFAAVCFHLPYPKLALKGLKKIMDKNLPQEKKDLLQNILNSLFSTVKRWGISIQVPSSSDFCLSWKIQIA